MAHLGDSLNQAVERMADAVGTIREESELLATSSEELTAVSEQMSGNADDTSSRARVVMDQSDAARIAQLLDSFNEGEG